MGSCLGASPAACVEKDDTRQAPRRKGCEAEEPHADLEHATRGRGGGDDGKDARDHRRGSAITRAVTGTGDRNGADGNSRAVVGLNPELGDPRARASGLDVGLRDVIGEGCRGEDAAGGEHDSRHRAVAEERVELSGDPVDDPGLERGRGSSEVAGEGQDQPRHTADEGDCARGDTPVPDAGDLAGRGTDVGGRTAEAGARGLDGGDSGLEPFSINGGSSRGAGGGQPGGKDVANRDHHTETEGSDG